eukprot:TRINITY_DN4883_c0_g5_i1.p1 TRINITY_DN4883_c0_g5~~TRINITY_DN4883_c0_g5_i1.p1  ORF type:complete len:161 (+),score=17.53 TRINITY_DN4883_c0_g5_i1:244-726(+)
MGSRSRLAGDMNDLWETQLHYICSKFRECDDRFDKLESEQKKRDVETAISHTQDLIVYFGFPEFEWDGIKVETWGDLREMVFVSAYGTKRRIQLTEKCKEVYNTVFELWADDLRAYMFTADFNDIQLDEYPKETVETLRGASTPLTDYLAEKLEEFTSCS